MFINSTTPLQKTSILICLACLVIVEAQDYTAPYYRHILRFSVQLAGSPELVSQSPPPLTAKGVELF